MAEEDNENKGEPELDEFDMMNKRKYRYGKRGPMPYRFGKRSAMPYRFGRKRNWESEDKSEISNLKKILEGIKNENSNEDLDDFYSRALYRYGRK